MARLNIEDSIYRGQEFQDLLIKTGNRHTAKGMVWELFQTAQEFWFPDKKPIPRERIARLGLGPCVEVGLAEAGEDGVYVHGSEKAFAWLFASQDAGKASAAARAEKRRSTAVQPPSTAVQPPSNVGQPLTLTLSPPLSLSQKKEGEIPAILRDQVQKCKSTWAETLEFYKKGRPISPAEETEIARAIQKHGAELVDLALFGARFEKPIEDFKPSENVWLERYIARDKQGQERCPKFASLGASARKLLAEAAAKQDARAEVERPATLPPEDVRKILAASGFGKLFKQVSP